MQNLCCRNVLNVKFPKIVAEKFAFYRPTNSIREIKTDIVLKRLLYVLHFNYFEFGMLRVIYRINII